MTDTLETPLPSAQTIDTALQTALSQQTPLPANSHTNKTKFISHVSEEHQDELAMLVQAHTGAALGDHASVHIDEIYLSGLLLRVNDGGRDRQYFVAFTQPIGAEVSLKDNYIALIQKAASKLGKRTLMLKNQHFTVMHQYYVSPNMLRLVLRAPSDTPVDHAGYAYLFDLTTDSEREDPSAGADDRTTAATATQATTPARSHCYYTLRKAWHDQQQRQITAWVDVYIHGDTPGGNWARTLQPSNTLTSTREYPEKIAHLTDGQCLLICDETSMPTVARLLETWQNLIAPLVIAVTNDPADRAYFDDITLSTQLADNPNFAAQQLFITNTADIDLSTAISDAVVCHSEKLSTPITKVWGALEASDTKLLRRMLKPVLNIPRQDMVLKVYWRKAN